MKISEKHYIDSDYKELAAKRYFERTLQKMGCEKTAIGHYVLNSSNELRGVDLVFERDRDGRWSITEENRRVLFDLPTPETLESALRERMESRKIRNLGDLKVLLDEFGNCKTRT